jgi:acyl carrier protein
MENIKEDIRQFILSECLIGESASNLQDETPLRTSGILDSVSTLRLVSFIEEHYGIEVEAYEAGTENFECVESITSFINSKINRKSGAAS